MNNYCSIVCNRKTLLKGINLLCYLQYKGYYMAVEVKIKTDKFL